MSQFPLRLSVQTILSCHIAGVHWGLRSVHIGVSLAVVVDNPATNIKIMVVAEIKFNFFISPPFHANSNVKNSIKI